MWFCLGDLMAHFQLKIGNKWKRMWLNCNFYACASCISLFHHNEAETNCKQTQFHPQPECEGVGCQTTPDAKAVCACRRKPCLLGKGLTLKFAKRSVNDLLCFVHLQHTTYGSVHLCLPHFRCRLNQVVHLPFTQVLAHSAWSQWRQYNGK